MFSRTLARTVSQRTSSSCAGSVALARLPTAKTVLRPNRRFPTHSVLLCRRPFSTPPPHITLSDLPMNHYHALADATMTSLLEQLEVLLDDLADDRFEVDYHSGVLTLNLDSHGTYVINKQPPNKQIWLSSPVSGPKRYDYVPSTNDWRYSRNGEEMRLLLEQELAHALGRPVTLRLEHAVE